MTENTSHTLTNDNKRSRELRTTDSEDGSISCETTTDTEHNQQNPTVLKGEQSKLTKATEQAEMITLASKGPDTNGCHYDPSGPNSIRQDKRQHNDGHRDKVDPKLLILSQAVRITTLYLKIDRSQIYQLHQQKNKMRFKSVQRNNKSRPKIPAPAAPKTERATTDMLAPLKFQQLKQHMAAVTLYQRIDRVQIHQLHDQRNIMKPKLTAQTNEEYTLSQVTQHEHATTGSDENDDCKCKHSIVPTKDLTDNRKSIPVEKNDIASRNQTGVTSDKARTESSLDKKDAKPSMFRTSHDTIENGTPNSVISDDKLLQVENPIIDKSVTGQHNVKTPDDQIMACETRGQYLVSVANEQSCVCGSELVLSDKTREKQSIIVKVDQHLKPENPIENTISKSSDDEAGETKAETNTLKKIVPNVRKINAKKEEKHKQHSTSLSNAGKTKLLHLRNHIGAATLYQRLDRAQIYQLHEQRNKMKIGQQTHPVNANGQADTSCKKNEDKQDVDESNEPISTQKKTDSVKLTDNKKVNESKTEDEASACDNEKYVSIDDETNEGKQTKEIEHLLNKIDARQVTNRDEVNRPTDDIHNTHTSSGDPCIGEKNDSSSSKERRTKEINTKKEEENKIHITSKSNTGKPKILHLRNHIGVATMYQRLDRAQVYQLNEQRNKMTTGQKATPGKASGQTDPLCKKAEDKTDVKRRHELTSYAKTDSTTDDQNENDPKAVDNASYSNNEKNMSIDEETNKDKRQKEKEHWVQQIDAISTTNGYFTGMISEANRPNNEKKHDYTYSDEACKDIIYDSSCPKEIYTPEDNVGKNPCETDRDETSNDARKLFHLTDEDREKGVTVSNDKTSCRIAEAVPSKVTGVSFKSKISVGKYCVNEKDIQLERQDSYMLHASDNRESSSCCVRNLAKIEEDDNQSAPVSRADTSHDTNWKPEDDTERLVTIPVVVHENTAQTNDGDNVLSVDGEGIGYQQTMVEDTCITGDEEEDGGMFGILAVYATSQLHVDFLC